MSAFFSQSSSVSSSTVLETDPLQAGASSVFSLREKLVADGVEDVRATLQTAYLMVKNVRGVNLRRFNPRRPMEGIRED